jgi:hypothetical protein
MDRVVSTKLFPENTERLSSRELLSIDSVNETRLLVFVLEIYIIKLLIVCTITIEGFFTK